MTAARRRTRVRTPASRRQPGARRPARRTPRPAVATRRYQGVSGRYGNPVRSAPRRPDLLWGLADRIVGGIALAVGTVFRAHRAEDIPAEQRRDTAGLAALATAALLAVVTWWPATSHQDAALRSLTADITGVLLQVLPLAGLLVAWRLFRHPHRSRETGRVLRGAVVRLRLRRPAGPGPGHPESLTGQLGAAAEDWLAALDAALWPRQAAPGRPGPDNARMPRGDDQ